MWGARPRFDLQSVVFQREYLHKSALKAQADLKPRYCRKGCAVLIVSLTVTLNADPYLVVSFVIYKRHNVTHRRSW